MEKINDEKLKNLLRNIEVNPDPEWVFNTRNNIISLQLQKDNIKPHLFNFLFNFRMNVKAAFAIGVTTLIVISGGTFATVKAAELSKPGDFLFGLNKTIENVQRSTINDPKQKTEFESEILNKRVSDMDAIKQTQDDKRLTIAIKEVNEQEDNLLNSLKNCSKDCNDLKIEPEQQDINNKAQEIKDDAKKKNDQEIENEASDLINKTKSTASTNKETEKTENNEQNESSSTKSETENETEKESSSTRTTTTTSSKTSGSTSNVSSETSENEGGSSGGSGSSGSGSGDSGSDGGH